MDFNAPNDFEYGGGKPDAYESADGTWFFGTLAKQGGSTGPLKLIIWHVAANGTLINTWADSGVIGQGGLKLQGNGRLDAEGYLGFGDNQTMRAIPVPNWKTHAIGGGTALTPRYVNALNRLCAWLGI